ncbi:MAG: hypothetical protein ACRD50_00175 [Candidatus Acidiferrales bacterium]
MQLAWKVLIAAYLGMAMISWALIRDGLDLSTRSGRHLLAGALANGALVIVGLLLTATAYRRGERWAWFANLVGTCYGLPLMAIDSHYFGILSRTVAPQVAGASLALIGLLLPIDVFFRRASR